MKDYIFRLMSVAGIPRNAKLQPEEREALELSTYMRQATLQNRYNGVWFHIPNEGKRSRIAAAVLKCCGMLSGVSDFCFITKEKALFIELKIKPNKLSPYQIDFFAWCADCGIDAYLCYSAKEAINILINQGVVKP